jgi:hypothetical protein
VKKISLIISILLSINVYASNCISFEGVKKRKVVESIRVELKLLGVHSKINAHNRCNYKIYLPINVIIVNNSGAREIKISFHMQKEQEKVVLKNILTHDSNRDFYDMTNSNKNLKSLIIKKHSKLIAKSIEKELF